MNVRDASDPGNASTMAVWSAGISTRIASVPASETPSIVLINIGTHDLNFGLPNMATWQTQYIAALDAMHAAWPNARIYITTPWLTGKDADADTMATSVAAVIAARSTFVAALDDERAWLKPNVATYTDDGIHYNVAGQRAAEAVKRTALGF